MTIVVIIAGIIKCVLKGWIAMGIQFMDNSVL